MINEWKTISYTKLGELLSSFSSEFSDSSVSVFVFSFGGHIKGDFDKFTQNTKGTIAWQDTVLPSGLQFLRHFMGSEGALIQLDAIESLSDIFIPMTDLAMAELLVIPEKFSGELVDEMKNRNRNFSLEDFMQTKGILYFAIDGDSFEEQMPSILHDYQNRFPNTRKYWNDNSKKIEPVSRGKER